MPKKMEAKMKVQTFFKTKTERNPDYLAYIRTKPCLCCGAKAVPHHESLTGQGMGMKASDKETIPLCNYHHHLRHLAGKKTFYKMFYFDHVEEIHKLQREFKG